MKYVNDLLKDRQARLISYKAQLSERLEASRREVVDLEQQINDSVRDLAEVNAALSNGFFPIK